MTTIPNQMKALQIEAYQEDPLAAVRSLRVVQIPTPKPKQGQVLIKVEAAPCNPSDLLLLQGRYGRKKPLPAVPGWEGAGTVVAAGGGFLARWLVGKRVAFSNQSDGSGTWAEYCSVEAKTCIALKSEMEIEQGASLIINPLTALGMVDTALKEGHKALIQNAAASQVGRMVARLAEEKGIPAIHIVRRADQEAVLKELGAKVVLNSESKTFQEELQETAAKMRATIAFDAVAGPMTGQILRAMPNHSKVCVYGALSATNCADISPLSLIFQQKSVQGFYLSGWLAKQGLWGLYQATNTVQKLIINGTFHTDIQARTTLEDAPQALEAYQKEMTKGKVLIFPST